MRLEAAQTITGELLIDVKYIYKKNSNNLKSNSSLNLPSFRIRNIMSSLHSFDEAAWLVRVKTIADHYLRIPDGPALPLLEKIFQAPQSYWDQFNIKHLTLMDKIRGSTILPWQQSLISAEANSLADHLFQIRRAFLIDGESVFRFANPSAGATLELIYKMLLNIERESAAFDEDSWFAIAESLYHADDITVIPVLKQILNSPLSYTVGLDARARVAIGKGWISDKWEWQRAANALDRCYDRYNRLGDRLFATSDGSSNSRFLQNLIYIIGCLRKWEGLGEEQSEENGGRVEGGRGEIRDKAKTR